MSNLTYEQLVEKVSKAICMVNCHNPDAVLTDNLDHSKWEIYVPDARAAISTIAEVLKEPTESMDEACRMSITAYLNIPSVRVKNVIATIIAASPLFKEGE